MTNLAFHNWLGSGQSKLPICRQDFMIHMTRQLNHLFAVAGGKKIITIASFRYNYCNIETTH